VISEGIDPFTVRVSIDGSVYPEFNTKLGR